MQQNTQNSGVKWFFVQPIQQNSNVTQFLIIDNLKYKRKKRICICSNKKKKTVDVSLLPRCCFFSSFSLLWNSFTLGNVLKLQLFVFFVVDDHRG